MANIVITTSTNLVKVDFGVYATQLKRHKASWDKNVLQVNLIDGDGSVEVNVLNETQWTVTYDGTTGFQIDSIDGATPSSNSDLYDKLVAMLG